jgi:transposase
LFPKIENWKVFKKRVELICKLILSIHLKPRPGLHLYSIDEKSGMQALERKNICLNKPGRIKKIEYEYTRHGTTCLMGALNMRTGKLEHYRIQPTRKEEDFDEFVQQILSKIPKAHKVTFILDQLNTHKSESLVRTVAKEIGFKEDLGKKQSHGILKTQASRMEFLENTKHRIRFVYTPKHCSWLNPIENWFGRLQRQRLTGASFESILQLKQKVESYIEYSNEYYAKPYKWKFKGFAKRHKLNTLLRRA